MRILQKVSKLVMIVTTISFAAYAGYQWNSSSVKLDENPNYRSYRLREKFMPHGIKTFQNLPKPRNMLDTITEPWKVTLERIVHNSSNSDVRWTMIALVKSAAGHFQRRSLVRKTWGKMKLYQGVRLEVVFLIGNPHDQKTNWQLLLENRQHGDILQMDIKEIYKNVAYKVESGLMWAHKNFPLHWLCVDADDDVFPMLPALYRVIEIMKEEENERYKKIFGEEFEITQEKLMENLPIHCGYDLVILSQPQRNPGHKYYISYEDFAPTRFPPYCQGGWYTLPVKLAGYLTEISRYLPVIWIDDAYFSGYVRLIHYTTTDSNNVINWGGPEVGLWTIQRGGLVYHFSENSEYPLEWYQKHNEVFQLFDNRLLSLLNLFH